MERIADQQQIPSYTCTFVVCTRVNISITSSLKCFSQALIFRRKSLSTSLVFLSSPTHSSRHLLCLSSFAEGNLKIPIPLVLRQEPHPITAQLTPGCQILYLSQKRTQKNITFSTNFEKPRSFEQAHILAAILKSMCAPSKSRDIPKTLTKSSPFEVCRPS